jgi:hypothetical protein
VISTPTSSDFADGAQKRLEVSLFESHIKGNKFQFA